MELITCNQQNLNKLIAITHTTYREHYQYLWKDKGEQYIKDNYNATTLTKELADSNVALYFIMQNAEIYGFLKLQINAPLGNYTAQDALELARIYLLKKATGKGFGKSVMKAVEEIALNHAKKLVWLKTMKSSEAVTFYQNFGYEISGQTTLNVAGIYPELQGQLIMKKLL